MPRGQARTQDKGGTRFLGHLQVLGEALQDIAGWTEAARLNLPQRLGGTANAGGEHRLRQVELLASLLKPLTK